MVGCTGEDLDLCVESLGTEGAEAERGQRLAVRHRIPVLQSGQGERKLIAESVERSSDVTRRIAPARPRFVGLARGAVGGASL